MKNFLLNLLLLGLVACSPNQCISAHFQHESQSDLPIKSVETQFQPPLSTVPLISLNLLSLPSSEVSPSDPSNFMTLMGQSGALLTVWALPKRNWLWAYANIYSQNFGTIRNWKIEPSKHHEHFRFVNQSLGTCIEAYGNGLIHDTCSLDKLAQEFELLPTDSGAVVIKSVSQGRCVTYNPVSTTHYSTVTLSTCDGATNPLRDQTWYLAPPVLKATAIN